MGMRYRRFRALSVWLAVLVVSVVAAGCGRGDTFDARLGEIVEDYRFSYVAWEWQHLVGAGDGDAGPAPGGNPGSGADTVRDYVSLVSRARSTQSALDRALAAGDEDDAQRLQAEWSALRESIDALEGTVEGILAGQIRSILAEEGIRTPADRLASLPFGFPPINFAIQQPPYLLVVSPRDRIESMREVMLIQHLDAETMLEIEQRADALGVSSLVLPIGGFGGVYPTFVAESTSIPWLTETATEEWLHQYLAFTPLGFLYVLDLLRIRPDYEIATMNETAAGLISEEIGQRVVAAYYPEYVPSEPEEADAPDEGGFSFNAAMRETRLRVDDLLAAGEIEEAERYMEERRLYLEENGYRIRKLNQAYFAFYGTYAQEPSSVSPIGQEVRALREQSTTLQDFVNQVASLRGREDLQERLVVPAASAPDEGDRPAD